MMIKKILEDLKTIKDKMCFYPTQPEGYEIEESIKDIICRLEEIINNPKKNRMSIAWDDFRKFLVEVREANLTKSKDDFLTLDGCEKSRAFLIGNVLDSMDAYDPRIQEKRERNVIDFGQDF